jgi:ABC-type nitrate/sulfonate/bicarbonate transport system ATPase subunit
MGRQRTAPAGAVDSGRNKHMSTYELKGILLELKNVALSFGVKPVLKDINVTVRDIVRPDVTQGQVIGILGPSGIGKCLGKGTPVLMFDGSIKKVEDVERGDLLMGPDSKSRTVLALGRGYDQLYRIVPSKGDAYVVNSAHILPLRLCRSKRSRARLEEVSVTNYLKKSRTFKNRAKMYRAPCIEFPKQEVPVDPYLFGLWLGDGDADSPTITTKDGEVVEAINALALAAGAETSQYVYGKHCPKYRIVNKKGSGRSSGAFLTTLRSTGAFRNKHIPSVYTANTSNIRRDLLAGLLDSDGSLASNCFDFISKSRELSEGVCYVARSLGLAAYITSCIKQCQTGATGIYHRVCISGDIDSIPVRVPRKKPSPRKQIKNVLNVGFSVEEAGYGEYFGFQLDGDGLFLLGDFTVTHNTQLSRIMTGLQDPSFGQVLVGADRKPIQAGMVGYVPQNYPLLRHRTVLGNLVLAGKRSMSEREAKEKALDYLRRFDLADKWDAYPAQLSGGQRQRIAIAQQLLCSEHYLILDEPTTGLDPIMKDRVCNFITQVSNLSEENTIIVITHDISAVLTIADQLWILGRVRNEKGESLGATIVQTYNLIERGIAWQPNASSLPAFGELQREIRAKFETL